MRYSATESYNTDIAPSGLGGAKFVFTVNNKKISQKSIKESVMKIWRIIGILLLGLLSAILIYPILHEGGHALATILFGGKVCEFHLLPLPFVICESSQISLSGMILIGLSGMLFPLLFSWVIYLKNFWVWLIGLYLNFICLLSFAIALYGCIRFINGSSIATDDITKVLELCPGKISVFVIALIVLIIGMVIQIIISKPLQHCNIES